MFPQLNWVDSSLLGIEASVYEIIHKPFFFKELLVVKEVRARKDSFKEASSFELFICLYKCLFVIFAHVAGHVYPWSHIDQSLLVDVLNNFEFDLAVT